MKQINLNQQQKRAVEHEKGPLLIIAGAGTGKTTVITERIKWLIVNEVAKANEIVALTFTEKAAYEMEERVDMVMPYGYTQLWIATFHSFCDQILRDECLSIGLDPGYRLITEAESIKLVRDNLFKFELDYFRPLGNPNKFVSSLIQHFSRLKDEDISPADYWQYAYKNNLEKEEQKKYLELAHAYRVYEELKVKEGVMDFGDLISNTLKLFRQRKNILEDYQKKFKYILVDEFQDTNIAQYELIKLLAPASKKPNLTVVGDDNQSIYKFRGAAVSNILSFQKDYPYAKTIVLNFNYRSTQTILDSAYRLIKFNDPDTLEAKLGISKKLISMRKVKGLPIQFIWQEKVEDEADEVALVISQLKQKEKYNWSDFAILVRANNHAEPFTRALQRRGIPYQFLGPGMLYRQEEIKELIAYLKVLKDPTDSASLYKVLSMEIFGFSGRDLASLLIFSEKYNLSLFEAIEKLISFWFEKKSLGPYRNQLPFLTKLAQEKLNSFLKMLYRHLNLVRKETAGQLLYYFLEDSGLLKKMISFSTEKEEKKAQNIAKFFERLKNYENEHEDASVWAVVDFLDLAFELGESPQAASIDWTDNNAVNILTVHSSKGLEFRNVFLVNLVSQRFPTLERKEKIPIPQALIKEVLPQGDYHLEEERRLFYVGLTRAQDHLFLTAAKYYGEGKRLKQISPFVVETLGQAKVEEIIKKEKEEKQLTLFNWTKSAETVLPLKRQPVTYLSYSQIQTFKTCPLHYKLKYILKIPTPPSAALSFGTTVHNTFRDFYQWVISGHSADLATFWQFYEKNWLAEGFVSKKHEQLTFEKGKKYIKEYFERYFSLKNLPLALEVPFKFPIKLPLLFGGKIDRVDRLPDGRIEIIDYKTGEKIPSQKEVDQNLQLTLYALAAVEVKDQLFWKKPEEVVLSLYYFEEQKKISTTRNAEQLQKAKEEVLKVAKEIEVSDFSCSGTEKCRNCEYKLYCQV